MIWLHERSNYTSYTEQTLRDEGTTRNVSANDNNESMKQQFLSNKLQAVLSSVLFLSGLACIGISIPRIYILLDISLFPPIPPYVLFYKRCYHDSKGSCCCFSLQRDLSCRDFPSDLVLNCSFFKKKERELPHNIIYPSVVFPWVACSFSMLSQLTFDPWGIHVKTISGQPCCKETLRKAAAVV